MTEIKRDQGEPLKPEFENFLLNTMKPDIEILLKSGELLNEGHIQKYMQSVAGKQLPNDYTTVINQALSKRLSTGKRRRAEDTRDDSKKLDDSKHKKSKKLSSFEDLRIYIKTNAKKLEPGQNRKNFGYRGTVTPFGQTLPFVERDEVGMEIWNAIKKKLQGVFKKRD